MSTCPHCGKETATRPPTTAEVVGPERTRELIEDQRKAAEQAARRRRGRILAERAGRRTT